MKFINREADVQIRIKEKNLYNGYGYRWQSVKTNEIVDLPEEIGILNHLEKVETTGQIGKVVVETKQFEVNKKEFQNKLEKIKGIGKKTAKDIVDIFSDEENLKKSLITNENIPIRDDVEKILKKEYCQ